MSETGNIDTTSSTSSDSGTISLWTPSDGFESTLVIDVKPLDKVMAEMDRLLASGESDPVHRYHFPSYDALHRVLAPNRMTVVRTMTAQGPLSIREIARRVGRDFKGVHTDVTVLLNNGLVKKTEDGRVVFPFESIHFDFEFGAGDQSAA